MQKSYAWLHTFSVAQVKYMPPLTRKFNATKHLAGHTLQPTKKRYEQLDNFSVQLKHNPSSSVQPKYNLSF